MAERRMFSKTIVESDAFIDMPLSTQALYFHYGMLADDEGFVNSPKKIQRMIGANEDDLKLLITKRFILPFESGIIVLKHWRINNYIQKDRFKETLYKQEKSQLSVKENGSYTECIQDVSKMYTQDRLGKVSIGKDRVDVVVKESDSRVGGIEQSDSCVDEIVQFYNDNIGTITPFVFETLQSYEKELGKDLVIYAMQKAVDANARNGRYIKAILNSWSQKGIKTLIEAQTEREPKNTTPLIETEDEKKARILREMEEYQRNDNGRVL